MASSKIEITGSNWKAITTANQSGFCFQLNGDQVLIDHSNVSSSECSKDKAIPLIIYERVEDILPITADDSSDIFYAICASPTSSANIIVDVK